jgi:hypothetical protein
MTDKLAKRTIIWTDPSATVETVRISSDNWFYLNDIKRRLFGFSWGVAITHPDSNWNCTVGATTPTKWWTPQANLDYLEAQLVYLKANGIRVVRLYLAYTYLDSTTDEANAYRALLDLTKKYNILVIVAVCARWMTGFNCASPTSGFTIPSGKNSDTLSTWMIRVASICAEYNNIITIQLDNELDLYYNSAYYGVSQNYSAADAGAHITWMRTVFSGLGIPLILNLAADITSLTFDSVLLPLSDIPSFDTYQYTSQAVRTNLVTRKAALGITGNVWVTEINKGQADFDPYVDAKNLTWYYPSEAFVAGASLVLVMCFQHYYWDDSTQRAGYGFYNWDNTPKAALTALMAKQAYLQNMGALIAHV